MERETLEAFRCNAGESELCDTKDSGLRRSDRPLGSDTQIKNGPAESRAGGHGATGAPTIERCCEWCRIPYHFWRDIRCIETEDDLLFCSAICFEHYQDATNYGGEVISELPFPWDRAVTS